MCLSQETDFRVFVENLLPPCCHTRNEQENGWNDRHPHILLFFHFEQNHCTQNECHRSQHLVTHTK
ncbi:Uncharacterised protein [Klebsiella pneumoniae]|nr:Uncharacterised protein [Klebsiella pneumoniae]